MESCSSEKPIIPMEELAEEEAVSVLLADSVIVDNNNNNNTFGSMNMDDFLTNIWTTEESNQNIPATGVRKSQEEVWSDMHTVQQEQQQQPCQFTPVDAPRQPDFEEMTLEAFLVKAGVVKDDPKCNPTGDGRAVRKKRALKGPMVERRQKRMIKNRESAARSRSRKQAYTVELETEVDNLNRENSRLDEEHKILAARRCQMVKLLIPCRTGLIDDNHRTPDRNFAGASPVCGKIVNLLVTKL